jgi:hypothetical protein
MLRYATPEGKAFLSRKSGLQNEALQANPPTSYLEAFDVTVCMVLTPRSF